jgi:cobalamin biosynthesis protein CobT
LLGQLDEEVAASKTTTTAADTKALALRSLGKLSKYADELEKAAKEREEAAKEREEAAKRDRDSGKDKGKGEPGDDSAGTESSEDKTGDHEDDSTDGAGSEGEGDSDGGEPGDDDGDSADDGDEGAGEGGDEGDSDDDEGGEEGEGDEGDGGSDEGTGEGADCDDDTDSVGKPGSDDSHGDGGSTKKMTDEELAAAAKAAREVLDTDAKTSDIMDAVKDEVAETSEKVGGYIPSPDAMKRDKEIVPPKGDNDAYRATYQMVQKQVSTMRAKLQDMIKIRTVSRFEADKERGVIDAASLYGLRTGNKRVFAQKTKAESIDTAVSILIDLSGSMNSRTGGKYTKAEYAKMAAVALGETLNTIGVPFEIIGFHNTGSSYDERDYQRWMPFEYYMFKAFNEQYPQVKTRLNDVYGRHENVDGEAVMFVAKRLAQRPERRKMLFVISDGNPCGGGSHTAMRKHLKDTVKKITKASIEVFGIGALTDSVKEYYSRDNGASYIVITDIEQLPVEMFKMLRGSLTDKMAR